MGALAKNRNRPTVYSGFTLVEVLVAFSILSIGLGALLQAFSSGLVSEKRALGMGLLSLQGQSIIAKIGTELHLQAGQMVGELPNGTNWIIQIDPLSATQNDSTSFSGSIGFRILVTLENSSGFTEVFSTYRFR